jgi:nitrate reductase cytochrome c-type subunit
MIMTKISLVLPALALTISCSPGAPPASVPESEIGLAPGTAFEQPPQAPIAFNRVDPGDSELRPRPNDESPPAIPHSIEDIETITLAENACLECHHAAVAVDVGAVAVPVSHHVDLRRTPDVTGEEPVGALWVCTSCHVEQTDTAPLVANTAQR